jgi:glycosyltransferase involved in cell wall biosynthesis
VRYLLRRRFFAANMERAYARAIARHRLVVARGMLHDKMGFRHDVDTSDDVGLCRRHGTGEPEAQMERPDVSVVIPARNVGRFLGEALEALSRQVIDARWEVIVVDNESVDDTALVAKRLAGLFADLRVVSCIGLGVNRARNVGVRAARAPKVLICDADDVVADGWLYAMTKALESSDIVGGRLVTRDLNADVPALERIGGSKTKLARTLHHLPYAPGGNMGFFRTVFDAIEGFDEDFRGGGDEVDFCWRAQYAGFSIAFVPEAVLHYRMRRKLGSFARQCYGHSVGTARLYAKHLSLGRLPTQTALQKLRVIARHLIHLGRVDLLLHEATRWDYVRRLARFAGALNGYMRFRVAV